MDHDAHGDEGKVFLFLVLSLLRFEPLVRCCRIARLSTFFFWRNYYTLFPQSQFYFVQSIQKPLGLLSVLFFGGGCLMGLRIIVNSYHNFDRKGGNGRGAADGTMDVSSELNETKDAYLSTVEGDADGIDLDFDGLM